MARCCCKVRVANALAVCNQLTMSSVVFTAVGACVDFVALQRVRKGLHLRSCFYSPAQATFHKGKVPKHSRLHSDSEEDLSC